MQLEPASFRDPSGFIFWQDNVLYRQVNKSYKTDYDYLLSSGLYEELESLGLLISHSDVTNSNIGPKFEDCYKIITPEKVPFISYPYEWSFSQLKDAALTTLKIQKMALEKGMTLKDASAYNIQFLNGKPIFIDTLSFEKRSQGNPWGAYRQFCQHFLAPLSLMAYTDIRLQQLLKVYIDGIPLDLASELLPNKTKIKMSLASHIHLHARSQQKYSDKQVDIKSRKVSDFAMAGLIDSLISTITRIKWQPRGTEWGDYYSFTNYSSKSFKQKQNILERFIKETSPSSVWDLGANTGVFSRIASGQGINTVAFDIDPVAVEKNHRQVREEEETYILPLTMDLTNPSSSIGWSHQERRSLLERGPVDMVFALALIHHLAISNNVPLSEIAKFLASTSHFLAIEFVPKEDSQVKKLLSTRQDIFPDYNKDGFEKSFAEYFDIVDAKVITGSKRTLYLMKKKSNQEN